MQVTDGARLDVLPTADVDLVELRAFLDAAYGAAFTDETFEHALGGVHVLVRDESGISAHAALILRRLMHQDRAVRTGYVEAVGVRPARRRAGLGGVVMAEVERLVRGGYELGALGSSRMALNLYAARGWQRWTGPLFASTPTGTESTPDNAVFVLPVTASIDTTGELACDQRPGRGW